MKSVVILGASGSIGRQTIEIIKKHEDEFKLIGVSIHTSLECLETLIKEFPTIKYVTISKEGDYNSLVLKYPKIRFFFNEEGLEEIVKINEKALIVNALVGFVGLKPTLAAINDNKDIALANKEALVCGGELINKALKKSTSKLIPVDSEHSALFRLIKNIDKKDIKKIIITASGGPFRDLSKEELLNVTKKEALNHPNWKMGDKITIDSATLVNKAFEIIEAHYLFDLEYEQIEAIMHSESIVHGLVELKDNSLIASMASPTMEIPLLYALSDEKLKDNPNKFSLLSEFKLSFRPLDFERFEALKLAYDVGSAKGTMPTAFNAANEEAVKAFLNDEIRFVDILEVIKLVLNKHINVAKVTISDIINSDALARKSARSVIENLKGD